MNQLAEWRKKAIFYWEKAQVTRDFKLRDQYTELSARYLGMARKFEDRAAAAALPNGRR